MQPCQMEMSTIVIRDQSQNLMLKLSLLNPTKFSSMKSILIQR